MFLFSMETCEEIYIEDHILATNFMDFLGRYMYASSFYFFIRFIEYSRFVFGKPLNPLLFSVLLPYHLSIFFKDGKSLQFGGGTPSPLPFMTTSLPLFNSIPSPFHMNHDIILLYCYNSNPLQHLKYPKMRRTKIVKERH
jgi:hypothetical protein